MERGNLCATSANGESVDSPAVRNCKRDGGRSSGVGMQVQTSNRLKLLWSKAMVVSVEEKAYRIRQV